MRFSKIGARQMVKSLTARDYVQNGLVAMWDGIENAGWGVHDPNATTWVDLCRNNELVQTSGTLTFGDNYAYLDGSSYLSVTSPATLLSYFPNITVEIVFTALGNGGVMNFGSKLRGWWIYNGQWNVCNSGLVHYTKNEIVYGAMQGGTLTWKDGVKQAVVTPYTSIGEYITIGYGNFVGMAECRINALRVYSRVLSDAEITMNYAVDKLRFNLP